MTPVPRLLRWIFTLALFLLAVMTLLRVGTYLVFVQERVPLAQAWVGFWLGFRFDARVVASAMLPLLVLGGVAS